MFLIVVTMVMKLNNSNLSYGFQKKLIEKIKKNLKKSYPSSLTDKQNQNHQGVDFVANINNNQKEGVFNNNQKEGV